MTRIDTIYVDMDGVLYNWSGQYGYMEGYTYLGRWFDMINKSGKSYQEVLRERMDVHATNGLYLNGEKVRDADLLMQHLVDIKHQYSLKLKILSAVPHKSEYKELISKDKTQWLKDVGYYDYFDDIIFTNGSWNKLLFASHDSVLIDDYDETMIRFNSVNAPFILHRKVDDTIKELSKIL